MTQRAYPLDDTNYLAEDVRLFHVARTPGIFNATVTLTIARTISYTDAVLTGPVGFEPLPFTLTSTHLLVSFE